MAATRAGIAGIVPSAVGADQREAPLVRNGENDPAIAVLKDVAPIMREEAWNDDMRTLHQADVVAARLPQDAGESFPPTSPPAFEFLATIVSRAPFRRSSVVRRHSSRTAFRPEPP